LVLAKQPYCAKHPGALAGWRCDGCSADLCPGCVFITGPGTMTLDACVRCGGYARPIRLARMRVPLLSRLPAALAAPLRKDNLSMLVTVAAVMALLQTVSQGSIVARLVSVGAGFVLFLQMVFFWTACFATLRAGRRGEAHIERPDLTELSAVGASLAGSLALLPLLLLGNLGRIYSLPTSVGDREMPFYLVTSLIWTPLDTSYFAGLGARIAAANPLWWCLGIGYLSLLPLTLLGAAEGGVPGLNPLAALARLRSIGSDSFIASCVVLLLGGVAVGLHDPLDAALAHLPYLGRWLAAGLTLYPYFAASAFLGTLAFVHGEAVGLGTAEEFSDLALPGVEPRATGRVPGDVRP
jgi:hypothetical protein